MKRRILIFGSIIAVVILILASLPSVVSAQSTEQVKLVEQIKERLEDMTWIPGSLIGLILILYLFIAIIVETMTDRWLEWIRF